MSAMSNYLENKLADHIFRTSSYTKPAGLYVALFTVTPSDAGGGTEVTGGSYARVQCGPSDVTWMGTHNSTTGDSSGTGGLVTNVADITFAAPSANWGTIVAYGIFDALSGGNMLVWGAMSANKTVNNGDAAPKFLSGSLQITFA